MRLPAAVPSLVAAVFLIAACDPLPTAAPQDPDALLRARTAGVTLTAGESGSIILDGGPYRVAWVTEGCSLFQVAWIEADGQATPIKVDGASGDIFVDLPAGSGSLDRAADCDYTIRFEAAP